MRNTISELDMDVLIRKYAISKDGQRIEFTRFLKELENIDRGISPTVSWA